MGIDINLKILSYTRRLSISREWIQYSIIVITIIASNVIAYWGSISILAVVLVGVGGIVTLGALLKYPNLGIVFLILVGMFLPFSGPGGINASVIIGFMIVLFWLLDMVVVKKKIQFIKSQTIRPVHYFIIVSIVAFGMGQIPWFVFANQAPLAAQLGGFGIYFLSLIIMIAVSNLIKDIQWLKVICWVFVGFGAFYVLCRTLNFSFHTRLYQHGFYANSMYWMWLVVIPLSQAIFNNKLKFHARFLLYGITVMTFYDALIKQNDWKSGWFPAAVVIAVLFGLRFKKLVLLGIPFALFIGGAFITELISTDFYSWSTRLDAWVIVLGISRVSPLWGLGFANYYWYTILFPIRGWAVSFNSHNQFVDLIGQTGIAGLLCFLWVFFEVGRLSWKLMKRLPDGFAKGYAFGVFAGVCGSLVASSLGDWLLPFPYNIGLTGLRASILPWIFFGGLISIEQLYSEKPSEKI